MKNISLEELNKHIEILNSNKIPKDNKGNIYKELSYNFESEDLINKLFDALIKNNSFKGSLYVSANPELFDDSIGFKVGKLIEKDNIKEININNKLSPFSDRVSSFIGDKLNNSTNLSKLDVFLDIDTLSFLHIFQFLFNKESSLKYLGCLKISENLLNSLNNLENYLKDINHFKIKKIEFYYVPETELNILYSQPISQDCYIKFSDNIQIISSLEEVKIIPWYSININTTIKSDLPTSVTYDDSYENFIEYNKCLKDDIDKINITFDFSCKINTNKKKNILGIEKSYRQEEEKMKRIIEKLDLSETSKEEKNSIVSIRSYLNKTIGELLNKALYELDIYRIRNPDNKELCTAKGSIKFIATFLIEENSKQLQQLDKDIYNKK